MAATKQVFLNGDKLIRVTNFTKFMKLQIIQSLQSLVEDSQQKRKTARKKFLGICKKDFCVHWKKNENIKTKFVSFLFVLNIIR